MKIAVTLLALAPMVLRIAMSRCFSITSRISDATMLSAATMTIRKMVREMAIFSRPSAEKSDLFMSAQSCVTYSGPSCSGIDCAMRGAAKMSSTRSWIKSTLSLPSSRLATSSDRNPYVESNSNRPRLNSPTTRRRRVLGSRPAGVSVTPIVNETESPVATPSFAARSLPSRIPGVSPSGVFSASRLPLVTEPFRLVTCCSSTGSMPLI